MRIAIIGAGPAGAMAAVRLARAGASVQLFDPSHPREKPCGGGLTGRALALISDVVDLGTLAPVVVRSAVVEPPSPRHAQLRPLQTADVRLVDRGTTSQSSLVVVSRAVFDRAMTDAAVAAGARLIPEKTIDVHRRDSSMVVRTARREYEADYLLGADGTSSLVRRKLATPFARAQLSIAAGYYVHGLSASRIVIQTRREQPGYLWSFPRRDHLAIGICAPASHAVTSPELRAQALAWIEQHGLHRTTTLTPYAWPIPSVGFEDARGITFSGPGWMLLGDAAGLVDPLTREGIYYALQSGQWAADALAAASPALAGVRYAERLADAVQPELARAARLSAMFFSPVFGSLLVDALRRSPRIREVFADLVAGRQPYLGLRRRLLATREWTLATRAIGVALQSVFAGTMKSVATPEAT